MKLPIYIVDAFTDKLFRGNPAAVCPLEKWLPDDTMQHLAAENNLSETVFFVQENEHYHIRWFTPLTEVKLCGHATLASAHIFYTELGYTKDSISFNSLSGILKVTRKEKNIYTLNFPATPSQPAEETPDGLFEGLRINSAPVFKTSLDYMVVLPSQKDIEELMPDFKMLAKVKSRGVIATAQGVIATAKGDEADFVSRCFYPQSGIDEDPVTGSAHTITVPYWAKQLNKTSLKAVQLSRRRGYLDCELQDDRVLMSGSAVTYLRGEYTIP